ncbi:hypothetical protein CP371_06970 [Pediococcus acidilactici]|nr:hypothetical protein CP371_06970 [Pediococcus acidilactici]
MIYVYMTLASVLLTMLSDYVKSLNFEGNPALKFSKSAISKFLYCGAFLIIFVPGAIRYYVGVDYTTYSNLQIPMVLSGNPVKVEALYRWVIKIGYWMSGYTTYQLIFAITNFLIVFFLFLYIKDQSKNKWLSILIFMTGGFFYFSLSGMRQAIGVVIALWALKFIKEKRFWYYLISIIVASLFHTAAIVFLVFYFVDRIEINPYVMLVIMVVVRGLASQIRELLIVISSRLGLYSEYFGGKFDVAGLYSSVLPTIVFLVMVFLCISRFILGKDLFYKNQVEINIHYVACLIVSMINFLPTPTRLLYLFIPVYITLIPNIISFYEDKRLKVFIYVAIVIILSMLMYVLLFVQNSYSVLPYRFVWNGIAH